MIYRERTIFIYCDKCKDEWSEKDIKVLNVEEGPTGEDIYTVECPYKHKVVSKAWSK